MTDMPTEDLSPDDGLSLFDEIAALCEFLDNLFPEEASDEAS